MATNLVQIKGTELPTDGAALNVANRLYIDTTDNNEDLTDITTGKWAWLARGISEITPSWQEKTQKTAYYDGDGHDDTEVTGKSLQLAVKGVRYLGDAAQDYIDSKQYAIGSAAKTRVLWINNGMPVVSKCTLTAITPTGGAADAQQNFSVTIAFDGAPKTTSGQLSLTETDTTRIFTAAVDDTHPASSLAETKANTPKQN